MRQDLGFALRLLIRDRTFTLAALLTLTLTIGANTIVFSIVRSVLFRPLPIPDSDRVVLIYNAYPNAGAPRASAAVPDYFDRRERTDVFEEQALYRREGVTHGDVAGAQRIQSVRATPSFFRLVGARPLQGRIFLEEEGEEGRHRSVLLSYGFWKERFGGDPAAIGRDLRLNGIGHTIVGVLPPDFRFLYYDVDVWVPAAFTARERSDEGRHSNNWTMIARLKPGATLSQAQQQIDAVNAHNHERFPELRQVLSDAGFHTGVVLLQDDVVRDVRPVLYLLWGGVIFVLLIGCVNLTNLVMVRSSVRSREMATRHAIGASVGRLGRQLFTETTLLALIGGALGVLAGWWILRSIAALRLDPLPRGHEIQLDPMSVAVVLGLATVVGLAIGMLPAIRLGRMDLSAGLREEGRSGTRGRGASLLRRALATAQVAIAFVLLVGAGLMFASFRAAARIDLGFQPAGVVTALISLPGASYADDAALVGFSTRLLGELRSQPGVEHAGLTSIIPFSGEVNSSVILAEGYVMKPGESLLAPMRTTVSEGYFETMRIPLKRGRYFTAGDTADAPRMVIVDERLARRFWPDQDPIGRRMYFPGSATDLLAMGPETQFLTVVGVVGEVQVLPPGVDFDPVGAYYFPYSQTADRSLVLAVRTAMPPASMVDVVRRQVAAIDPELPVYGVQTMAARFDEALITRRVPMLIAVAFGAVALFLAAIGIYGVLAYGVAQRRREIGIRMALGSTTRAVFAIVLGDGARIVVIGIAIGLAGAFLLGRAMTSVLFGVAPSDPLVIAWVAGLLAGVALLAVLIPARRAARVNPMVVLSEN
jgi:predicted permease